MAHADLILTNARITTMDERTPDATALAVEGGRFVAVGSWSEFQFAERRMPTLRDINEVAPDTPVFVLHLYDRAWLNGSALRATGFTKDTPDPPCGEIERDSRGNPTTQCGGS